MKRTILLITILFVACIAMAQTFQPPIATPSVTIIPTTGNCNGMVVAADGTGCVDGGTNLHSPGPIGDTTPSTGAFTQMQVGTTSPTNINDVTGITTPNIFGAAQPFGVYQPQAIKNFSARTLSTSMGAPAQLRVAITGDSTAGYHNLFVQCQMIAKWGSSGIDFGGGGGVESAFGEPCGNGQSPTMNSTTGVITSNNGISTITPGVGAPFDQTRSPDGIVNNIASGGSITWGSGGEYLYGNVFKVYYDAEPTDGTYGAAPGTLTVVATSPSSGSCPSGCTIFTGSTYNATLAGGVMYYAFPTPGFYTITTSASGGAVDVHAIGAYDNTSNGIIAVSAARGGLSLPDMVSTPSAVTGPWYASAFGAPVNITAWSINSANTVATFTAANNLTAGQILILGGFTTGTFFQGQQVTVLSSGLTSTSTNSNPGSYTSGSVPQIGTNTRTGIAKTDQAGTNSRTCQTYSSSRTKQTATRSKLS